MDLLVHVGVGEPPGMRAGPLETIVANAVRRFAPDARLHAGPTWLRVEVGPPLARRQGWKLHLSADVTSAEHILHRALPVLLADKAVFKLARTHDVLAALNGGESGLSQVGKFVTVYPRDDAHAVRLARGLGTATRDLSGPRILSDRRLGDSVVHYRYGAFEGQFMQSDRGAVLPALSAPNGRPVPDRREVFAPPAWARDPFVARALEAETPGTDQRMVGGRYLILGRMHRSPRGGVFAALDTERLASVMLKQALRDAPRLRDGRTAPDRLRHEHAVLRTLAGIAGVPRALGLVEHGKDVYLVLEDADAAPLREHVAERIRVGLLPSDAEVIDWGRQVADILAVVHSRGFVHGDVTATNVLLGDGGAVRLVDLELARRLASPGDGRGTRGYLSPAQAQGQPASVADDVYALGALLRFGATGADPGAAPVPDRRPARALNPAMGDPLAAVIQRSLEPRADRRFASMAAVAAALEAAGRPARGSARHGAHGRSTMVPDALVKLFARALRQAGDRDPRWRTSHPLSHGAPMRDLHLGTAGVVHCLADLARWSGRPDDRLRLKLAAIDLVLSSPIGPEPLPGLYVGEAGVGAALLAAAQALDDASLLADAVERGGWVATQPHTLPDLFGGSAGRIRYHLMLHRATGGRVHLDAAWSGATVLLDRWSTAGIGGWALPGDGDVPLLGMAHGVAGVADVLLDLAAISPDARIDAAVADAVSLLLSTALPVPPGGSGLSWPERAGGLPRPALWCHGAAGIGRFLLRAYAAGHGEAAGAAARRAARTVGAATRWASPGQCHGLAGAIEYLLDVHAVTGEPAWRDHADDLANLLSDLAVPTDGGVRWHADVPGIVTPDLLVGDGGILHCLLRLADPSQPPLLSLESVGKGTTTCAVA